jgi:cell wall-associated NlpC family hydrolase
MNIVISDLIGKPFEPDGILPGFNCWTLAKEVFKRFGVEVKDYHIWAFDYDIIKDTYDQDIKDWIKVKNPPTPALITMRFNKPFVNHVAVYLGHGNFIHAHQSAGVCKDSFHGLHGQAWKRMTDGFYIPG